MARHGKDAFPGDLNEIAKSVAKRLSEQVSSPAVNQQPQRKMIWWLAILALVIVAISIYFVLNPKEVTSPSVDYAMSYYDIPPFVLDEGTRGTSEESVDFSDISDAYKNGDFEEVFEQTKSLNVQGLDLYQGIALLELGKLDEAISALERSNDDELEDMRLWYLALGYLRTQETESALLELKKIVDIPDHYKRSQSIELIEKIRLD